jgi:hypothetical protein
MRPHKIIPGMKFGRLAIVEETPSVKKQRRFTCICDCGRQKNVRLHDLLAAKIRSCGCLHNEGNSTTHGLSRVRGKITKLYQVWGKMRERCLNPNNNDFAYYGGRGITVCPEWMNFQDFHAWAAATGYREELTIERLDNNKGYSPNNCKWATRKEQSNNKRNNILITFKGHTKTLRQWADHIGVPISRLKSRYKLGWSPEELLTIPKVKNQFRVGAE